MYTLDVDRVGNESLNRNSAFGLLTTYCQNNPYNRMTVVIDFSHQNNFHSHTALLPSHPPPLCIFFLFSPSSFVFHLLYLLSKYLPPYSLVVGQHCTFL